ncbi:hypothetical protein D1007_13430 [Hordeum vulgare]|nr:hypothetical protein D1007_13430 [Hordeum vulgare]
MDRIIEARIVDGLVRRKAPKTSVGSKIVKTRISAPLKERTDLDALSSEVVNPIVKIYFIPDPSLKPDMLRASELASAELSPRVISSTAEGSKTLAALEHSSGASTAEAPTLHRLLDQIQALGMANGIADKRDDASLSTNEMYLDCEAFLAIHRTISPEAFKSISTCKSAHEVWTKLEDIYGGSNLDEDGIMMKELVHELFTLLDLKESTTTSISDCLHTSASSISQGTNGDALDARLTYKEDVETM